MPWREQSQWRIFLSTGGRNYEIWNDKYVKELKVDVKQTNYSYKSGELSKVKVTCDGFYNLFLTQEVFKQ